MFGMSSQQVKQVSSTSQLGYYEQLIVDTKDIIQSNDIVVPSQFSQDIDFFLQLGNVLGVIAEHNTLASKLFPLSRAVAGRVSLRFAPRGNAHLTIAALANDQVTVQEIRRSALRGIQHFSAQVIHCRGRIAVIGHRGRRKSRLETVRIRGSRILVKSHVSVVRHRHRHGCLLLGRWRLLL